MSDDYLGEIKIFAGKFEPIDWAFCDGRLMSIEDNEALFAVINIQYGGDGRTNFRLPDLRGRAPMSFGDSYTGMYFPLGMMNGSEKALLTQSSLPKHTHSVTSSYDVTLHATMKLGLNDSAANNALLAAGDEAGTTPKHNIENFLANPTKTVYIQGCSAGNSAITSVGESGGNTPHNNMQPWIALNYIICINGLFPTRD